MAIKIGKLSDTIPYVNMLVFADSGAGKTVLAGSDDRVLFMAPERDGVLSAIRMGSKANLLTREDDEPLHDWLDIQDGINYLIDHPEITAEYDWLAVDSAPEMQSMCMRYILAVQKNERLAKGHDPELPQIQDYGRLHVLFDKMIRAINDLPINVIYTATARKVEDAEKNEFLVPDISGKDYGVAMKTVALMTSYGYLRTETTERPDPTPEQPERTKKVRQRVIYWEDTGTIRGKDRTTRLTPLTVLPPRGALKYLRKLIDGDMTKAPDGGLPVKVAAKTTATQPKPEKVEKETEGTVDLVDA